jgi:uncharacterized protein with HEPN domain
LPPRSWRFRIQDIFDAPQRVAVYLEHKSWEDFDGDSMLQEAIAYNLIVIGEAATALPARVIEAQRD